MIEEKDGELVVIYHADCMDGFTAAWAIRQATSAWDVPVEFVAARHGTTPPPIDGKHVLIVDFNYRREVMLNLKSRAKSLLLIDHHKSARDELGDLDFCVFDMNRSGAALAWDYAHGTDKPRPWIVNYVQDRDLWRHELPYSKEVNAVIATLPFKWEAWDKYAFGATPESLVSVGKGALLGIEAYVRQTAMNARTMKFGDDVVPIVNCAYTHISEVVGKLAEDADCGWAIGWFQAPDGRFKYSLRSRKHGPDVSVIAKRMSPDGGGHAQAAGFTSKGMLLEVWSDGTVVTHDGVFNT